MNSAGFRCLNPLPHCAVHVALSVDDHQLLSRVKQQLSATFDVLQ